MSSFSENNSGFKNIHICHENINSCRSRLLTPYQAQIPLREIFILLDRVLKYQHAPIQCFIQGNILFSENSLMFHSVCFAWLQPGQPSPLFQSALSHSPHVLVQFTVFTLRLYWPDLKNVQEALFLRLPERRLTKLLFVTCRRSACFWELNERRSDQRQLSSKIMSPYS